MNRQTIYVLAYPKSGGSWLSRLLGDALNSPVGGINTAEDDKAMATEGQDRPGPYYIRHGHAVPVETGDTLIPDRFSFAYKQLKNERVVILIRDPRDVAVSAAAYWGRDLTTVLHCMGRGEWPLPHGSGWVKWVREWMDNKQFSFALRYEDLNIEPFLCLRKVIIGLGIDRTTAPIERAVARQSFTARVAWTEQHGDTLNYGKEAQLRFLRKGVVGDWENHFTPEHRQIAADYFGKTMWELGYTEDERWMNE